MGGNIYDTVKEPKEYDIFIIQRVILYSGCCVEAFTLKILCVTIATSSELHFDVQSKANQSELACGKGFYFHYTRVNLRTIAW